MRLAPSLLLSLACLSLACLGCRKSEPTSESRSTERPAAPTPPPPAPPTAPPTTATAPRDAGAPSDAAALPHSEPPSRELMRNHFTAVLLVRDAMIAGNLGLAKANASFLARREREPAIASWSMYVDHLRERAAKVAAAPTLEAAAQGTAALAQECGNCHAGNQVTPLLPSAERPAPASGPRAHMMRHHWAAEQMWNGLIGPSEQHWNAGVSELAEAPLGQGEIFPSATAAPWIAQLATDVHTLGADGAKAKSWDERAAIYGRLLATCARCHAAVPDQP